MNGWLNFVDRVASVCRQDPLQYHMPIVVLLPALLSAQPAQPSSADIPTVQLPPAQKIESIYRDFFSALTHEHGELGQRSGKAPHL